MAAGPATDPVLPPGYRYLRMLGEGGFGAVHLAEQERTGRQVAIKHIQRHVLGDPETLERFRREARVLATTDVPTVVRVLDLDTSGDPAYLVMEYVPGATLYDLMCRGPLPAGQALTALRDVADALREMAARGLVHRDIKPSNVLVLPDGRAKLADFGLARSVLDDGGFRTVGAPAGTPAYFPPEVSSGTSDATPESDAYSFAVMAYEALTGTLPIEAPDAISLITAHWTQPPRPVGAALPGFPADAGAVLMRALAKTPQGRPLPHELMAALDAVPAQAWPTRSHRPVPSTSAGPGSPTTVVAPVVASSAPAPPPATGRTPRRRTLVVGAAVAVVAAAVGGLLLARLAADTDAAGNPTVPLDVARVSVTADPAHNHCPAARVRLVATIATSGAGDLTVSWQLPDGGAGPRQSFTVAADQTRVRAVVNVDLSGRREIVGEAVAVVRPSGLRGAAPVRYTCDR